GAVAAELLRRVGEAAAVVDQITTGAGEFVRLLGDDADGEFFTGQVGAGQFERLGGVGVFDVDDGGLGVFPGGGQLFEGGVGLVGFGASRGVVFGGHACCFPHVLGVRLARLE